MREKEHGKNYLLETYLKGLAECEEKESGTGDSGVHTEEVTTSPEVVSPMPEEVETLEPKNSSQSYEDFANEASEIHDQIELLEKVVAINRRLQKEEEMIVRLGAKIKRYEADASGLSEQQVKEALEKVTVQIDKGNEQLEVMENDIKSTDSMLQEKSFELKKLYDELEEVEVGQCQHPPTLVMNYNYPTTQQANLNLSREYLAENMYNLSMTILDTPVSPPPPLESLEFISEPVDMFVHTIEPPSEFCTPFSPNKIPAQAQIHSLSNTKVALPPKPTFGAATSKNLLLNYNLEKYNQRNINNITATNLKLGPKKLINGLVMQPPTADTNSNSSVDTGMGSSLSAGERDIDFSQLGTLV